MSEPDAGGFTEKLKAQRKKTKQQTNGKDHGADTGLLQYLCTDYGNAQRLIALHGDKIRYSHDRKKWLVWEDGRWEPDGTGHARLLMRETMSEFLTQAVSTGNKDYIKFAVSSLFAKGVENGLKIAQPEIFIEADKLDTHPYLINFLNGTLDLKTGVLREHNREDYLTKLIHYNYNPDAKCPLWEQFIREILDPELIDYVQRCFGYSLAGVTSEKAVFVLWGKRDAGKSTLLTTFRELIREYATVINIDTVMSKAHETSNTLADLADLNGVRFAQTSEAEKDQRLSVSKLKAITQGMGMIRAARKYENPISFPETHKLWIDTNDKPQIRDVDDQATFSRLHPIPFTKTIDPAKIDRELKEKLQSTEAEGILAWAVAGALQWRKFGLTKPKIVSEATENWKSENDNVSQFICEMCEQGYSFTSPSTPLYNAYKQWCDRVGEHFINHKEFSTRMKNKGFEIGHGKYGNVFQGLRMRRSDEHVEEDR